MRLPVIPCWMMTTGQPLAGLVQAPPAAVAFGTVTSTGIFWSASFNGRGLKRVTCRLAGSSPGTGEAPAAVQNFVSTEARSR